jgi:hypothetical protein
MFWPSFRYWSNTLFTIDNCLRNIKTAIACAVFAQVSISIITRAYNVQVLRFVSGSQPARTSHVTVSLFVYQQAFYQFLGEFDIGVKKIATALPVTFQLLISAIDFALSY